MYLSRPTIIATIRRIKSLSGLDAYGLAIADAGHFWTLRERREFEKRVRELREN
jgi:hypothetical protein